VCKRGKPLTHTRRFPAKEKHPRGIKRAPAALTVWAGRRQLGEYQKVLRIEKKPEGKGGWRLKRSQRNAEGSISRGGEAAVVSAPGKSHL